MNKDFLKKYEKFVDSVWNGNNIPVDPNSVKGLKDLFVATVGLGGETGEALEKIKKYIRDGELDKKKLNKELGDVLYYVTKLAHLFGYSLEDVMETNIAKLSSRVKRGTMRGSGDDR